MGRLVCRNLAAESQKTEAPKTEGSQASSSQSASSPPPPPPPSSSGGGGVFWKILGLTTIVGGGTVAYAWYDPNFKKTLEGVPYLQDALPYIFKYLPENSKTQSEVVTPIKSDVKPVEDSATQGLARTIKVDVQEPQKEVIEQKAEKKELTKEEKKKKQEELVRQKIEAKEAEEAVENAAMEIILEEAGRAASQVVEAAVAGHAAAVSATIQHAEKLRKAMDIKDQATSPESEWQEVSGALDARLTASEAADKLAQDAKLALEKLKAAVEDGKKNIITKKNQILNESAEGLAKMEYDLQSAINKLEQATVEAQLTKDFKDLVEKGKEQFRKEIESIVPEIKIKTRRGKKMTEDELNSLIAHAHRRLEQLQKQLAEQQALEQQRLDSALSKQREEYQMLSNRHLEAELNKIKSEHELQREHWDTEARVHFEQELRQQLTRQAAAHSDHLAEVLRVQKQEWIRKFDLLLAQKLEEERDKFHTETAGWIARLRGIEAAIEGRAELEKQGRQAQQLWIACQSLQAAILSGQDTYIWEEGLKPLQPEVDMLLEASNNHPFVTAVVETIPESALKQGVWTEDILKERFHKVRTLGRRVALIDETGGSLFKYLLSYIQSIFIFKSAKILSDEDEIDPDKVSTFTLLDSAAACLERGNLELAVRLVNQLTGESRRAAEDWLKEAKLLLETKMAADALLAHAAASGVGALS